MAPRMATHTITRTSWRIVHVSKCNVCSRKISSLSTSSHTKLTLGRLAADKTVSSLSALISQPHSYIGIRTGDLRNMSSDADYAAFLDKANQDIGSAESRDASQKKEGHGTKSVNTAVPKMLEQVEEYYVSDADEPFEPVALKFEGSSVSAGKKGSTWITRGGGECISLTTEG